MKRFLDKLIDIYKIWTDKIAKHGSYRRTKNIILVGLICGIVMLIAGYLVSQFFVLIYPSLGGEYNNSAVIRPWSDPAMNIYFIIPLITGVMLAWIWTKTNQLIREHNVYRKGVYFGFIYWIFTIPGMLMTYASFSVTFLIVLSWSVATLCQGVCAGIIFSRMLKQEL